MYVAVLKSRFFRLNCNVHAFRYKRILFFYELPRRGSFRSLLLRLRYCLLWCRELSMPGCLCVVPRTRMLPLIHGAAFAYTEAHPCCRAPWFRAPACRRSPMVPRVRPNGLIVFVLPRTHGAARGRTLRRLSLCCRASPMVPLSLRAAALRSFVAAQFSILPRTVACGRAVLHAAAHPWCRARNYASSSTCGTTLRVFAFAAAQWSGLL